MSDMLEAEFEASREPAFKTDGPNLVEWIDLVTTILLLKGVLDYATENTHTLSIRDAAKEFDMEVARQQHTISLHSAVIT
ncbi:hypothetical protein M433DRAFT_160465 [Acidomyces richmondensis BFW]|nr:hypothetical protein M433DRAFT_161127 [Acidomyces richmondensis BFW]KYG40411.1 hypothetical protein M433DRAFT_160465 [Acidomyces richmondensis BFW]